jgi:protein arginine N-methyltransferase 1
MLADKKRVEVFRRAIFETVKEGDVVADIGTGTGILACFAVQAGARRVYAVECGPVIDVARRMAEENGFEDRIAFIQGHSMNVTLPERVDVVMTETVGCFAFDEGITAVVDDARRRFLNQNGCVLPRRLVLQAVPVQFVDRHPWGDLGSEYYGLKNGHLMALAANTVFSLKRADLEGVRLLARPAAMLSIDLSQGDPISYPVRLSGQCQLAREGFFHGILVYPEIVLTRQNRICLLEGESFEATHWEWTFFPNRQASAVRPGQTLFMDITVTAEGGFAWRFKHRQNGQTTTTSHLSLFGKPSLSHLIPR